MNNEEEAPFHKRSGKTPRSPTTKSTNPREPTLLREDRTRSQQRNNSTSSPESHTSNINQEAIHITQIQHAPEKETQTRTITNEDKQSQIITERTETQKIHKDTQTHTPQKTTDIIRTVGTKNAQKMTNVNLKEIQQNITNFIPEFNGSNELTRFLGAADNVYNLLANDEEKKIFGQLIKFRLTGNAYSRISNRQIDDYLTLKATLNSMYTKVWTLGELERRFIDIRQSYGETIRDFGHRVIEALENYKSGYKTKYGIPTIDITYSKHLDDTAIQAFKRGLNNTILREKIATIKATNLDEIMNETETTERMLEIATGATTTAAIRSEPQTYNTTQNQRIGIQRRQIICNYCQKAGHTYDICRLRLSTQNNTRFRASDQQQKIQYNMPTMQTRNYTDAQNLQPRFTSNIRQPTQQTSYVRYEQPIRRNNFQPKYCDHCKTTTGHSYDECRSKFFPSRKYGTSDHPRNEAVKNHTELEDRFNQMKINYMKPQSNGQQRPSFSNTSGNADGSNQL